MMTPLEISFRGVEKSDAVKARVEEKVAWLEKHFGRMTHCRVLIDSPHRKTRKGKVYHVKLEIGVPGSDPIIVNQEPEENRAHEDILVTIRDAFDAARRRIDDVAATRGGSQVRGEKVRRRPLPDDKTSEI